MPPSAPRRTSGQSPSLKDLPYGPLPARSRSDRPTSGQPSSSDLDQILRFPAPEASVAREGPPDELAELEVVGRRAEADDDVHFGVAAKALGVSRKTVERMVKRGQLARGPSGATATGIAERAEQERGRDELLLVLATGGWRQRRRARRAALQRYVLRHDLGRPTPDKDE